MSHGWIGVDLDGTLAHYEDWIGVEHIGDPIPEMLKRVRDWLNTGREVRIFTARVSGNEEDSEIAAWHIRQWCLKHIGQELVITNVKDFGMAELWDDRCVQIEKNTGLRMDGLP